MPVPVQALRQYQYQYCHKGNARTGIGTIGKNKSYQYGHHMYDCTGIGNNDMLHISTGIVGIRMPVPV
jgi:N-acetylglutamate synthase/N-acetylornithine aminotransferase